MACGDKYNCPICGLSAPSCQCARPKLWQEIRRLRVALHNALLDRPLRYRKPRERRIIGGVYGRSR